MIRLRGGFWAGQEGEICRRKFEKSSMLPKVRRENAAFAAAAALSFSDFNSDICPRLGSYTLFATTRTFIRGLKERPSPGSRI